MTRAPSIHVHPCRSTRRAPGGLVAAAAPSPRGSSRAGSSRSGLAHPALPAAKGRSGARRAPAARPPFRPAAAPHPATATATADDLCAFDEQGRTVGRDRGRSLTGAGIQTFTAAVLVQKQHVQGNNADAVLALYRLVIFARFRPCFKLNSSP